MHHCNGCDSTWTGYAMAHCPLCHETFSTVGNFDRHFDATWKYKQLADVKCKPPEEVGLVHNDRGTWKMPGEKDISGIHKEKT